LKEATAVTFGLGTVAAVAATAVGVAAGSARAYVAEKYTADTVVAAARSVAINLQRLQMTVKKIKATFIGAKVTDTNIVASWGVIQVIYGEVSPQVL
jgi:hypothetical protein